MHYRLFMCKQEREQEEEEMSSSIRNVILKSFALWEMEKLPSYVIYQRLTSPHAYVRTCVCVCLCERKNNQTPEKNRVTAGST